MVQPYHISHPLLSSISSVPLIARYSHSNRLPYCLHRTHSELSLKIVICVWREGGRTELISCFLYFSTISQKLWLRFSTSGTGSSFSSYNQPNAYWIYLGWKARYLKHWKDELGMTDSSSARVNVADAAQHAEDKTAAKILRLGETKTGRKDDSLNKNSLA